jgi:hypothetical protein
MAYALEAGESNILTKSQELLLYWGQDLLSYQPVVFSFEDGEISG